MSFKKGNQLWRKGVAAKKAKQDKMDALMATIVGNGVDRYAEILDKLSDGEKLDDAEKEYLDRIDSWREYVKPKLARREHVGGGEDSDPIKIENTKSLSEEELNNAISKIIKGEQAS